MRKLKAGLAAIAVAAGMFAGGRPAHALIVNFGVDIFSDGSVTTTPFYDASDEGRHVFGGLNFIIFTLPGETYTVTFDPTSVFGGYASINSATLFVDAVDIGSDDNAEVSVQGTYLGDLANNAPPISQIPLVGGGTTTGAANDVDNTFFALPLLLVSDLGTDSTYSVSFKNADVNNFWQGSNTFRVDGFNIQADVTEKVQEEPTPDPVIPEPASMLLFGLGGLAAPLARRIRKS